MDVGYRAKVFGVGSTNFSLNVNQSQDVAAETDEASSVGITIAQMFNPVGANMAVSYKNYSYDANTSSFSDIDVLSLQTVFKF